MHLHPMPRTILLLAALAGLLALAGCSDDDPVGIDDPEVYPAPDTPEQLMANFVTALESMDIEGYADCLHEDFTYVFNDGSIWDRATDLAGMQRLFSGEDSSGSWGLGVHSINVHDLELDGEWTSTAGTHPLFPDSDMGVHSALIVFRMEGGTNTITVNGEQIFYLVEEEIATDEGGTESRWSILGQLDPVTTWKNDVLSWGDVKRIYSEDDPGPIPGWPETPDELMADFEQAYDEMDIDGYAHALGEDFLFIFTNNDIWLRADDVASTTNMFAGGTGTNGMAVVSIVIQTMVRQEAWTAVASDHPYFPDSERALYQVCIIFRLEGGTNTITVNCDQLFYAAPEEVELEGGVTTTCYRLVGQQDMASWGWKNEDMSWGSIKALY